MKNLDALVHKTKHKTSINFEDYCTGYKNNFLYRVSPHPFYINNRIRPCNFIFVKKELDLRPDLHYNYLMKSNRTSPPGMILSVHGTGISSKLDGGYAAGKAVK